MSEEQAARPSNKGRLIIGVLIALTLIWLGLFFIWRAQLGTAGVEFQFGKDNVGTRVLYIENRSGSWIEQTLSPLFVPLIALDRSMTDARYLWESDITDGIPLIGDDD